MRLSSKERSGPIARGPYLTTLLVYTVTVTDSEDSATELSQRVRACYRSLKAQTNSYSIIRILKT